MADKQYIERESKSICRRCFHSYVCEQFNEHRDCDNEKCHFFNDHFVPAADVVEVVRCIDCVYANEDGTICHYWVGRDTEQNGYCDRGEMEGKGEGE